MQNQNPKNQRQLKVYGKYRQKQYSGVVEPEIRLKGIWLKKLGFNPGQHILIAQEPDCITITLSAK